MIIIGLKKTKPTSKSTKNCKMQKVAKEQFLQIIVFKLKMRLYGVPIIQIEFINIGRHVINIPTHGKGHCIDGGQHW